MTNAISSQGARLVLRQNPSPLAKSSQSIRLVLIRRDQILTVTDSINATAVANSAGITIAPDPIPSLAVPGLPGLTLNVGSIASPASAGGLGNIIQGPIDADTVKEETGAISVYEDSGAIEVYEEQGPLIVREGSNEIMRYAIIRSSILPEFAVTWKKKDNTVRSLAGATAARLVVSNAYETPVGSLDMNISLDLVSPLSLGQLEHEWEDDETDIAAGNYKGQIEVDFPTGTAIVALEFIVRDRVKTPA